MRVEIVTIGDELLLGFTIDTNAAYLGRALADIGVEIVRRTTIGDEPAAIAGAVRDALDRTGAVVTTGGLGPTADDMTKPAIAGLFGRGMHVDEAHVAWMRTRWRTRYGREMPETNLNQARVPDGAELLPNGHGSAPGIWLEDERGRWVAMLPGVPREARGMCDDALVPRLRDRIASVHGAPAVVRSRTLRTVGIAESVLADLIGDAAAALEDVSVAYLPGVDGVDLRVTTRGVPGPEADARLDAAVAALRAPLGEAVYGEGTLDLAALVVDQLRARRLTLAVAESCTGGLLGARVTSVPGSSDVFLGGVIAYANSVKTALVGVGDDVLAAEGAVSEPVARRLATGARERTGAAVGVGITGVAGPGGGTPEKPVGMVWVAVDVSGTVDAVRLMLWGNREEIRFRATQSALDMIRLRSVPRA
ncbi:MAG TPA: competence/damage-inducible protein A [Gemmatimonadaceae bacterium]|nr:competence/damage-inducible protein A [Gemmatimonadaceae bacterium]